MFAFNCCNKNSAFIYVNRVLVTYAKGESAGEPAHPCSLPTVFPVRSHSMSHVMRKPVYVIYEQQRRKPACASAQSDQRLLLFAAYNIVIFYICNFITLASFFT